MAYTLGEAARATGKAKPTIARAIQAGRISASRSDTGDWQIDPAELHRVYPAAGQRNGTMLRDVPGTFASETAREREQAEVIRDLQHRLDASEAERRQLSERLHGLLTVKRDVGRGDKTVRRDSENAEREPANASENNMIDTSVSANAEPAADPIAEAQRERELQAAPSASSGLAIPRPPWWRRWFR